MIKKSKNDIQRESARETDAGGVDDEEEDDDDDDDVEKPFFGSNRPLRMLSHLLKLV